VSEAPPVGDPPLARVLVLGVGNALRGDDAAGLEAARAVRALGPAQDLAVREQEGEATGLIAVWEGADALVLIDAVRTGAPAGTIHRLDASAAALPSQLRGSTSSHAVDVAQAIELARALGRLPPRVVLFGIEGVVFDTGAPMSAAVRAALPALAGAVREEAAALLG
jgi:hydrogenase maturation protease